MTKLHPTSSEPLTLSIGQWTDGGSVTWSATIRIDPKLFAWLVNGAARRSSKTYQINEGNPPVKVTLTPA